MGDMVQYAHRVGHAVGQPHLGDGECPPRQGGGYLQIEPGLFIRAVGKDTGQVLVDQAYGMQCLGVADLVCPRAGHGLDGMGHGVHGGGDGHVLGQGYGEAWIQYGHIRHDIGVHDK